MNPDLGPARALVIGCTLGAAVWLALALIAVALLT